MSLLLLLLCLCLPVDSQNSLVEDRESLWMAMVDQRNPLSQRTVAAQKPVLCHGLFFGCHWLCQCNASDASDCRKHWQSQWHPNRIFSYDRALATLGNPRALPGLLEACQSSCVIDRLNGNKGLAQLTGKNLMSFGGYQASEGTAIVSGCVLLTRLGCLSRLSRTTNYLHRPAAFKVYLEWLSAERREGRDWLTSQNSVTDKIPPSCLGFETVGPRETIR